MSQPDGPDQAGAIRHLARRARRLAQTLTAEADRQRLLQHADELEQQAVALEQQTPGKEAALAPPVAQVQVQVQVQQQQETGPPAADSDQESKA